MMGMRRPVAARRVHGLDRPAAWPQSVRIARGMAALASLVWLWGTVFAGAEPAKAPRVDYGRQIRPIFADNCYACHGPDEASRETEWRLDLKESALGKLDSGKPALVPGKAADSPLYKRLVHKNEEKRMPPPESAKSLTPEQVELVKRWIDQGAEWKEHWSFVRPVKAAMPKVQNPQWCRTPIDHFLLHRLEAEGLKPSPEADKTTLIRRVTFDLTGLPPTLAEIDAFLADNSAHAYEKVVDRLLGSVRYGEHQTRLWLDAARYGDTHGLHLDNERSMWPYRDWLIRTFNANMPFDRFTIEQMAGDLLPNPTRDQLVATGFHRCNATTSEGGAIDEEFRVRYAADRVETLCTVWLGMTANCAGCHDHKYDPFTQRDYYRLFAYFNSVTERPMDGNALLPPPTVELPTPAQEAERNRLRRQLAAVQRLIADELASFNYVDPQSEAGQKPNPALFDSFAIWEKTQDVKDKALPKIVHDVLKLPREKRTEAQQKELRNHFFAHVYTGSRAFFDPLQKMQADLQNRLNAVQATIPATLIMQDAPGSRDCFVLIRGEYTRHGEKVTHGVPAFLPPLPNDAPANRLALAKWLVDPAHPLTARVTVNRFWQQVFGIGLVRTAEDFGSQGEFPSHPELLDWLAVDFIESGSNVKRMLRMLVTSAAYRQTSRVAPELLRKDPENRLLARGPRFRLDAEVVRDQALALSGLLVGKVGGKSTRPYQPSGLWEAVGYTDSNTAKFVQDHGEALYRRSMYIFWKRTAPPPVMSLFDAPTRESCTVRRARTNTPLQALALLNDVQFVEAARHLGQRMMTEGGKSVEERIAFGFRLATARRPQAAELALIRETYQAHLAEYQKDKSAAEKLLKVGESPRNGALDPAELAAWTMVGNLLLNLDETVTKG